MERNEQCSTCGTGHKVRACTKCATGYTAWNIWFRAAPPELKDHTGRISPENKRLLDGILDADFGGRATVQNIAAAVKTHLQKAKEAADAQVQASFDALVAREIAAATRLSDRNLAADQHLAARLQEHADLAAQKTLTARIKRLGKTLRLF